MTFLAPVGLAAITLLAIPIIIHLFKPRRMQAIPFSSLRWLKASPQHRSRRIQWHQWWLFLLRAGMITALVFALAQPVLDGGSGNEPVDRFLILDVSRSMGRTTEGKPTSWLAAQDAACEIIGGTSSRDRVSLLTIDSQPRVVARLGTNPAAAIDLVRQLQPTNGGTDLAAALSTVQAELATFSQRTVNRDVELVVITDHHHGSWQAEQVASFAKAVHKPPRITIATVGRATPNAWISRADVTNDAATGETRVSVEVQHSGGDDTKRSLRLKGSGLDLIEPLPTAEERTNITFRLPTAGLPPFAKLLLEPADDLPSDDARWISLQSAGRCRVLLVETAADDDTNRSSGVFIKSAFAGLNAGQPGSFQVTARTASNLTADDLQQTDVVILAGGHGFPPALVSQLRQQVREGLGLLLFLGPHVNLATLNEQLYSAVQPTESLLSAPLATELAEPPPAGVSTWNNVMWQQSLLSPLHDPLRGELSRCTFGQYAKFAGEHAAGAQILARYDDGTAALVDHRCGAGRVLLLNTSANDAWGDLPRRSVFVPFLDHATRALAKNSAASDFVCGQLALISLPNVSEADNLAVRNGAESILFRRQVAERGTTLTFSGFATPGWYEVVKNQSDVVAQFPVNVAGEDSQLTPLSSEELKSVWGITDVRLAAAEEIAAEFQTRGNSWPLMPWLIVAAGLLFAAEAVFAAWLCPPQSHVAVTRGGAAT